MSRATSRLAWNYTPQGSLPEAPRVKTLLAVLMAVMPVTDQIPEPLPTTLVVTERGNIRHLPLPTHPEPEPEPHVHTIPEPTEQIGEVPEPWLSLAVCESGMNGEPRWSYDGASGFDAGYQFLPSTWTAFKPLDYPAYAHQATPQQQTEVAERVQAAQGWSAWPTCARKLGLL